jgi:hypothetical protein
MAPLIAALHPVGAMALALDHYQRSSMQIPHPSTDALGNPSGDGTRSEHMRQLGPFERFAQVEVNKEAVGLGIGFVVFIVVCVVLTVVWMVLAGRQCSLPTKKGGETHPGTGILGSLGAFLLGPFLGWVPLLACKRPDMKGVVVIP